MAGGGKGGGEVQVGGGEGELRKAKSDDARPESVFAVSRSPSERTHDAPSVPLDVEFQWRSGAASSKKASETQAAEARVGGGADVENGVVEVVQEGGAEDIWKLRLTGEG